MNSALKPVLPVPGPQPGGQASPAKANVANINHAVGHPQGAQNSLHHGTNNLVGQNLTHHVPAPQVAPHAVPSMAPVSANMAQMAQNMSHHGNLSHVTQNSVACPPANVAASPSKSASTSAPLSLVSQEKGSTSQPLALTRTLDKKEPDSAGQANGTIDSPKSASNAPTTLKPLNPEPNKEKQDIAKTSPSTPKPPEKPISAPTTPQKPEAANLAGPPDSPAQPKVATANEPTEKSAKPIEPKPSPTADVAPTQSDSKPVPESANDSQLQENASKPAKADTPAAESAKTETPPVKAEEKKEEPKEEKPEAVVEKKQDAPACLPAPAPAKKEEAPEKPAKVESEKLEKVDEKKAEVKSIAKADPKASPKPTMKLATVTPPMRKRRRVSPSKSTEGPSSVKKPADGESTPTPDRTKRNRTQVQLYQSPTPELTMATKLSASVGRSTPTKANDDKLIVIYKNEYLAVRNVEGGFYVCQAMQNVYRNTRKIKIRWLSQEKSDASGETYKPDFYDVTDMECVLTTLSLQRAAGGAQVLKAAERARATSILERALRAEHSGGKIELTEEHPDGLDLSLYTDESQLEKKSRKRNSSKTSPRGKADASEAAKDEATPAKKSRTTPKRSPKSDPKPKPSPQKQQTNNKRKPAGSTPIVAATSKTATAVSEKPKAKPTPAKRTPVKSKPASPAPAPAPAPASATPTRGRRAAKEIKPSPLIATPSTSTGKTTRTPRKPPAKK